MTDLQGTDILFRRWDAAPSPDKPKAVFLLVHGLGAHSARWVFLAQAAARQGFTSFAIELRGLGAAPERPRGHVDSWRLWYRDILALREAIGREFPRKKVFLVGESMGGLITYDLAAVHPGLFDGVILMAPGFKNGMKFPLKDYLRLVLVMPLNPRAMVDLPFTSAMATRDREYAAVMDANPDELRIASLKLLGSFLPVQARAGRRARRFATPVLFLIPGIDHLIDERGGRRVFAKLAAADKTLVEYPEMFHSMYVDLDREKVFADILDWAAKRT